MPAFSSRLKAAARSLRGLWQRWGGMGFGSTLRLLLPGARFDYEREAGDLWSNSVLAIATKWLGDRFSRPLVRVSRIAASGDYVPVARHRFVDLWGRPNPYQTRRILEKAIGLSLVLDGNAYLLKVRSGSGEVVELWWLPHYSVFPLYPADGSEYLSGWDVWIDGQRFPVAASDIVHYRDGIDPRNDRLGLSAVKAQFRQVCTDQEASGYTATILRNLGVPGLVVKPRGDNGFIDRPMADRLKERLRDLVTGEARGDALMLSDPADVVPLGFSPEQLRLDKLPQDAISRLGAACGVPLMAMGLPDPGKTYSNVGESIKIGYGAVQSIQEIIAETNRWGLLAEFADPNRFTVEYDYSAILELREDQNALSTRVVTEWEKGVRSQNEAREALGLEPDPDGDRFYPGTGSPADMEQAKAMAELMEPKPSPGEEGQGDGPPAEGDDEQKPPANGKAMAAANGYANGWRY
jgi:HK97 family phage portal protein